MLVAAQREAESLSDQSLSDDLLQVSIELGRIVKAAEQQRYRRPNLKIL
jgi:hypothetical protein